VQIEFVHRRHGAERGGTEFRTALLYAGFLFIPSAAVALILPSEPEQADGTASAVD
jgi:hypothetical protein